jgi:hypothetical protein
MDREQTKQAMAEACCMKTNGLRTPEQETAVKTFSIAGRYMRMDTISMAALLEKRILRLAHLYSCRPHMRW